MTELLQGFMNNLNWSFPTWDLFILVFFVVSVIFYGLILGRDRILIILFSIYISLAVASNLPYITAETSERVGLDSVFVLRLMVFAGCMVGLYFLFSRIGLLSSAASDNIGMIRLTIFSVLHVGLIISVILSLVPSEALALSDFTKAIFTTDLAKFIWIIAPLIAMFFVKGDDSDDD